MHRQRLRFYHFGQSAELCSFVASSLLLYRVAVQCKSLISHCLCHSRQVCHLEVLATAFQQKTEAAANKPLICYLRGALARPRKQHCQYDTSTPQQGWTLAARTAARFKLTPELKPYRFEQRRAAPTSAIFVVQRAKELAGMNPRIASLIVLFNTVTNARKH